MKNRLVFIIVSIFVLSLSACTSIMHSREKPLRYNEAVNGNHIVLARCIVQKLYADSRPFMQLYHYKTQLYPAIGTAQIFAYDTRFLPYIYPSNSPQNPDAIRDYISANPDILPDVRKVKDAEYVYAFELTIKQTDNATSMATMKGNQYVSAMAWNHLKTCAATAN